MAAAPGITAAWRAQALRLKQAEPARYAACVLAMQAGEDWKALLSRLGVPDGTARGIQILKNRKSTPPHRRWYSG